MPILDQLEDAPKDSILHKLDDDTPAQTGLLDKFASGVRSLWNTANKPLVDLSPQTKQVLSSYQASHPIIGGIGNFATDTMTSLTSPLSLGLAAASGGSSLAEKAGMGGLSSALEAPAKIASAGMIGHGLYNAYDQPTLGGKVGGGLEAGLGALGLRRFTMAPAAEDVARTTEGIKPIAIAPHQVPATSELKTVNTPTQELIANTVKQSFPPEGTSQKIDQILQDAQNTDPVQKLKNALGRSQEAQAKQEALTTAERAKRFEAARNVTATGEEGLKQRLAAMGGEYPKVGTEPLRPQLTQEDADSLVQKALTHPLLDTPTQTRAGIAVSKLLDGKGLEQNEIDTLERVFGSDVADKLRTANPSLQRKTMDYVNTPKTLVTGLMHFTAPFRQGAQSIFEPSWWSSWGKMFDSFGSQEMSDAIDAAIQDSKLSPSKIATGSLNPMTGKPEMRYIDAPIGHTENTYQLGQKGNLFLSDLKQGLTGREDELYSNIPQQWKIPGTDIQPYKASSRAFRQFLNPLRQGQYDSMVKDAIETAVLKDDPMLDPRYNEVLNKQIASYVNSATGHGSLGSAEKYAGLLNSFMFSPRMKVGRLQTINSALNPFTNNDPIVRKAALKGLMSLGSLGLTVAGLGKLAGGEVSMDPTNADFGKVKFGDTRLDPWGGDAQMGVLAARFLAGGYTSSTSGKFHEFGKGYNAKTYGGALGDFAANQLSPSARFAYDLLTNQNIKGRNTFQLFPNNQNIGEIGKLMTPIVAQNLYELYQDDPGLFPSTAATAANLFGIGTQTYGKR